VLQHLSNTQISRIVPTLYGYRFLVVSEHVPIENDFVPECRKDGRCYHPAALPFRSWAHSAAPLQLEGEIGKGHLLKPAVSIRSYKGIVNTTVYELDSYPSAVEIPAD
jgi:hypothetical protein